MVCTGTKKIVCPRYPAGPEGKHFVDVHLFLTPESPEIVSKVRELLEKGGGEHVLKTIFDFVSRNIKYISDEEQHGRPEHWSFPCETLKMTEDDCEGSSFLLASLLLATSKVLPGEHAVFGERHVRVPLGRRNGEGHAWVEVFTGMFSCKSWYVLESTSDHVLELGKNAWKVEQAREFGYEPELYVYLNGCEQVGTRGLYQPSRLTYGFLPDLLAILRELI